jgi:hypothetical protein
MISALSDRIAALIPLKFKAMQSSHHPRPDGCLYTFLLVSPSQQISTWHANFGQQLHAHIKFLSRIEISTFRKLELHRSNGANKQWSKKSLGNFIRVLSRGCVLRYIVCVCATPLSANTHSSPQIVFNKMLTSGGRIMFIQGR